MTKPTKKRKKLWSGWVVLDNPVDPGCVKIACSRQSDARQVRRMWQGNATVIRVREVTTKKKGA